MARDPADRDPHRPGSVPEIAAKSRKEIAAGASEIAIDDFVDAALSERPKTGAPPAEPAPAAARPLRETVRGMGAAVGQPVPEARSGPPRPATPRAPAVFEAPETDRDPPRFSPSTTNFIAAKDQRISELEEQLAKAKQELARQSRPEHPAPAVRTVPMQAVAPQAAPAGPKGGTLFMPVNQAPPTPAASPYPAVLDPSLQAAHARPQPAVHPSAQYPAVLDPRLQPSAAAPPPIQAPPQARPSAVIKSLMQEAIEQGRAAPPAPQPMPVPDPRRDPTAPPPPMDDDDDGGGRTMMLDPSLPPPQLPVEPVAPVGFAPAPHAARYPSQHPAPTPPAHMTESTEKAFERPEPIVLAPKKRSLAGVLAVAAVLAIGLAGGAYAYRMELGPFASSKSASKEASTTAAAATSPVKKAPTATATSAPSAAPVATASATAEATASATPDATATPTASATPTATTPQVPDAPENLGALLSFQAYLTVTSAADAEVVVQGQSAGRTNTRLMVRCGPRNVRLRGEGSKWLSDGQHVQITCMQHTKVAIDPAK
jgi:hypothetical protein